MQHPPISPTLFPLTLSTFPVNTKHLHNICTASTQRLRRLSNIVQMLYKCFVFTGLLSPFTTRATHSNFFFASSSPEAFFLECAVFTKLIPHIACFLKCPVLKADHPPPSPPPLEAFFPKCAFLLKVILLP